MTKPARRTARLSPEARRRQLTSCGVKAAARVGLFRTVHAEVAREAEVSIATAFKYFPTSEDLVRAVVLEVGQFFEAIADESHKPDCEPFERNKRHVENFLESIDSDRDYALVWLEWSAAARDEEGLWPLYLEHLERLLSYIRSTIDELLPEASEQQREDQVRLGHALSYPLLHLKLTGASNETLTGLVRMGIRSRPM